MSKPFDKESGFNFFGRRYYSPEKARWTTKDPLGNTFGPNLYNFVHNRPLCLLDLYGLQPIELQDMQRKQRLRNERRTPPAQAPPQQQIETTAEWLEGAFNEALGLFDFLLYNATGRSTGLFDLAAFDQHIRGGGDPKEFVWLYRADLTCDVTKGKFHRGRRCIILVNGMLCSKAEFEERVQALSNQLGGEMVYGCYNGTAGFLPDLGETIVEKLDISTEPVRLLTEIVRKCIDQVGPEGNIWILCHSQGAEITWGLHSRLSKQERSMITVHSFGGARIIPKGVFKDAKNYISRMDPIPWIGDFFGVIAGLCGRRHLEILPSTTWFDHPMEWPTYSDKFDEVIRQYKKG
jgi:RHS repeat-associated protein